MRTYNCCKYLLLFPILLFLNACGGGEVSEEAVSTENVTSIPVISYSFQKTYPHDITSFTEGFLFHEGKLFESTGAPGDMPQTRSLFGVVDLATGKIDVKAELDKSKYFGEGITFLNGRIYQLTYTTKLGFIYDATSFKKTGEFVIPGKEGWGMTTDGTSLIMSEGSDQLIYIDPATMQAVKRISVSDNYGAVNYLNELEYINGFIYANVYGTNIIVKIDPATGKVAGRLDFTNLASEAKKKYAGSLEMNGIAYNPESQTVFITGKMWPYIFEVKF